MMNYILVILYIHMHKPHHETIFEYCVHIYNIIILRRHVDNRVIKLIIIVNLYLTKKVSI